ncbi:MAG: hypothetical protein K8S23_07070 [Candidatus Cloacimonetes bacterium]|nr:hypothetical protein [Candidatus Cloacimonadota bacterium]
MKAQNEVHKEEITENLPLAKGDSELKEIPVPEMKKSVSPAKAPKQYDFRSSTENFSTNSFINRKKEFTFQELFNKYDQKRKDEYKNLESAAKDYGGLQFNTYDWNFAPYLL